MQSASSSAASSNVPSAASALPQLDMKKLSRFFAEDKPPRKRLATALEFLKTSTGEQHELFWGEVAHGSMFFSVLHAYLTELETMYVAPEKKNLIDKMRTKKFQTDDWTDVFEGLEVLIKSNKALLASGWQHNRFLQIFQKLLLADNIAYIKKYAFRCLALYSDILMDTDFGLRNTAQLLTTSVTQTSSSNSVDAVNIGFGFSHLDLLAESIDFSPYASGNSNVILPARVYTVGSVLGWERVGPTQAEEPVDMLKYVMDLSLERSENITDVDIHRFLFWCDVLMHSYMPLLYPKTCVEVGLKDKADKFGFFHHCPGSFQRVMARWLYKLRSKPKFMDALWLRKEYVDVIMETMRQRFAYRDPELILDGIKFYSQLCKGTQYIPPAMKESFHEMHRAIIAHVSQIFHPSVHFDDPNIFIVGIELLELLSQQPLHIHSFAVLRKAILATTDASFFLRDMPPGQSILVPMVAAVYHTWMHGMVQPNGASVDVWAELGTMVRKWLTSPSVSTAFATELVRRWKVEVNTISAILQWFYSPHQHTAADKQHDDLPKEFVSTFVSQHIAPTVDTALVVLDRLLHVMSPSTTMPSLKPHLVLLVQESVRDLVIMWVNKIPALGISPSTLVSLFGEWFLPSCEPPMSSDFEAAQCVALETLCLVSTASCNNNTDMLPSHVAMFCRVIHAAIHDTTKINVISTVVRQASTIFGRCASGIHVLIPAVLHAIEALTEHHTSPATALAYGPDSKVDCLSCIQLLFGLLSLPGQYPNLAHESWQAKLRNVGPATKGTSRAPTALPLLAEFDAELHTVAAGCFQRLVDFDGSEFASTTDVQQRALWGLYLLVVLQLRSSSHPTLVKSYVIYLCDTCASQDVVLAQTALAAVHALHHYHAALLALEPGLVQHIVMALSLLVQQQVENASTVIRDHLEGSPTDQLPPPLHHGQRGGNPVALGSPTDNLGPDTSDVAVGRGRKRSNSWAAPDKQPSSGSESVLGANLNLPRQQSRGSEVMSSVLKTIVAKSNAIFESLTDWLMSCTSLLHDEAVLKLLFQALEAALIGSIPTQSEWQIVVEEARKRKRNMDTPLLFLGLAMRVSLDPDRHKTSLQCFSDIAAAAEGFLMHLLHHLHGFPSPAGMDQFVSTCTEFDDTANDAVTSLSFVYLNSIVLTVVGGVDAPTARIVVRDITGTYTWDAVAVSTGLPVQPSGVDALSMQAALMPATTSAEHDKHPWDRPIPGQHDGECRERLEVMMDHAVAHANMTVPTSNMCTICGGRILKPSAPSAPPLAPTNALVPFPVAKKILVKGNSLPSMPQYVFHTESHPGLNSGSNFDVYLCQCSSTLHQDPTSTPVVSAASPTAAVPICNLFTIDADQQYIGSLDHERCLLELLVDSIPMHYRDCGGDLIDKTLLGGRYTMQKYLDMEWDERRTRTPVGPMHKDSSSEPGFSFFQRLLHDDECYAYFKLYLAEERDRGRSLIEFCDALKKYERSFDGNDRLSQASLLYWEYLSSESNFSVKFPYGIASKVQNAIQQAAASASDNRPAHVQQLPLTLFQAALDHVEVTCFENGGLLDRFITSLNDLLAKKTSGPPVANDGDNWANMPIPHQLMLYDAFNVMELNVRICAETLKVKATTNGIFNPTRTALATPTTPSTAAQPSTRLAPLDMCRLFLGHVGILPNDFLATHHQVQLLDNGVKLERSLKHLDKAPSRETMKIGVVYVGPNQSSQQEILRNDCGSPAYEQFLRELGWEVDLATHRGFVGGLDVNPKSLSNGPKTLYYASSTAELIFHVVTMMPTRDADPQQIDKKRHVGNDYVHVVWSDNLRAYNQATITSNFNFVQVVLFPLKHNTYDGLVLVEVLTKPNVPLFGPLMTGMVVTQSELPDLVRQTVMNANRACRQQTQWYMAPYTTRRKLIEEVIERYAMDYSEKSMLTSLFKIPSPSEGHSL
ncbi:hypothetical protein, variant [Aphanomyces invadans]|uniref:Rap-GAP domain-containing protein n=1 Tax=Aphanomyces invadans TaxID=157072 RepID=A0A024USJ8_9STRA|nr:hypothetical protein, variant [Aphanomyces invadans]ETW09486.1 hypothetical protein, variant [Aphanomyces invadans]|eukprot:XP_008860897.1 hypothetical protein, variant [Aphanomyces invadans]